MRFISLRPAGLFMAASLMLLASLNSYSQKDWRPITPAELQQTAPKVEPDADAEAIFWEVRVDDSDPADLVMKHYIRVKVFTERGREKYSKIDIPFATGTKVKDIQARVIKSDGSIVELAKSDVFDREIVKADKVKVKAKSFAVPNIEPGVIVEYRYQEIVRNTWASNMRMLFQHDIPIQYIAYWFKPAADAKYLTFNMKDNKFVKDKGGFYRAELSNVPAIRSEPLMPPEDQVRSWLVLYYWNDLKDSSSDFWSKAGGVIAANYEIKDTLKPGKEIKAAAAQITNGATTPDEKLAKLYEFCKTRIKNITFDPTLTDDQREEMKPNKSTEQTYRNMQGTQTDINELFASLSAGLGYETRLAFGGDRSQMFFNDKQAHVSFVHFSAIGVKVNGDWKYYDPGNPFVPYGMLAWEEEDSSVLLLGYKDFVTTRTPMSDIEESTAKRTGKFKLLEDGTLEGLVKIEYTGQLSYIYKTDNYKSSANKREEDLKDWVKARISTAEVSDISIENVTDPEKPFTYQYKVRVPNYAQKTGKRLFVQPGFFTYGTKPLFAAATRKYGIFFRYPWSEHDEVEISWPAGFELDSEDAPADLADPSNIGSVKFDLMADRTNRVLRYVRKFHFGKGGKVLFDSGVYGPVKGLFDEFHKADSHTITLRQK